MRRRRTFVLGGARSGKSQFAEALVQRERAVDYVACGPLPHAGDAEWDERVRLHRTRRPSQWVTIETLDVAGVLLRSGSPVLVDCLTTWLARTMDDCGVWSARAGADVELGAAIDAFLDGWQRTRRPVVLVSNEVGSSIVPATESGRRFRDELGQLNARVAATADRVWLLTAGIPQRLR